MNKIKEFFYKLQKRKKLKSQIKMIMDGLCNFQMKIDSIDQELDTIRSGALHATDDQIGTLLHRKLLIQNDILKATEALVAIERELKGLF